MPISTQSAKAKGRRFQQWVRDRILTLYTMLEPDDCVSRAMGSQGMDIMLSPAAKRVFPYAVECKSLAKVGIYQHYKQASSNAGNLEPVVFIKADREKPLVIIDADYFLNLTRGTNASTKD